MVTSASPKKANCILLALYLTFVLACQIVVSDLFRPAFFLIGILVLLILSLVCAPFLLRRSSRLLSDKSGVRHGISRWEKLLFALVPLLVLLAYYYAYYPGAFSLDSVNQYRQAISNHYVDWHPVLHTFLAFKLPLLLSGGWIGSIVLLQMLIFSAALGYCFVSIGTYAGRGFAIGAMILVLANPLTGCIALYPWKDTAFSIGAVLLMSYSLNLYMSQGEWIKKPVHAICFVLVCAAATIFRHNAILFTAPLLLAACFQMPLKRSVPIVLAVFGLVLAVKGPLYTALEVEKPGRRQVETLGLPMNVIGTAVVHAPEETDGDVLDFAYKIAPEELWEVYYIDGSFNALKALGETDLDVIEEYGAGRVLDLTLRCIRTSPTVCLRTVIKLTEGVYTLTDPHMVSIPILRSNDAEEKALPGSAALRSALDGYGLFLFDNVSCVCYYGIYSFLLILAVLAKSCLRSPKDWKRILFVLPLFVYNFGTALLLTGYDDSPRFFYYTLLVFPLLLVLFRGEAPDAEPSV